MALKTKPRPENPREKKIPKCNSRPEGRDAGDDSDVTRGRPAAGVLVPGEAGEEMAVKLGAMSGYMSVVSPARCMCRRSASSPVCSNLTVRTTAYEPGEL